MRNDPVRTGLAVLVGAGWAFNLIAPAIFHGYQSSLAVNGPLMLVLGAVYSVGKGKQS